MKHQLVIKISIIIILLLGIVFADYMITQQIELTHADQMKLAALNTRNDDLNSLQKEYLSIESYLPAIDQLLPTKAELPLTIEEIETVAHKNNLVVTLDFSKDDTTANGVSNNTDTIGPKNIIFTLGVNGAYSDIINFYNQLNRGHYYIEVRKYDLTAPNGLSKPITVLFNVKLYVDPNFTL